MGASQLLVALVPAACPVGTALWFSSKKKTPPQGERRISVRQALTDLREYLVRLGRCGRRGSAGGSLPLLAELPPKSSNDFTLHTLRAACQDVHRKQSIQNCVRFRCTSHTGHKKRRGRDGRKNVEEGFSPPHRCLGQGNAGKAEALLYMLDQRYCWDGAASNRSRCGPMTISSPSSSTAHRSALSPTSVA